MGFIFGGDTGIDYETLQRRRAVADAMQKRGTGIARNLGEGIGVLGNAVFGKIASNRLDKQEAEGRKSASEAFQKAFSASRQRRAQAQAPVEPSALGQVETQSLAPPDSLRSDVMKALIQQESGGNPSAVSPAGAGGIAQIMPATARDPGYGVPSIYDLSAEMGGSTPPPAEAGDEAMTAWLADPANAAINEKFGGMYLDAMMEKNGGNRDLALASYNAGPGAVDEYGGIPPYEETQNYVKAINARLGRSEQAPQMPQANPEPVMSSPQPEQSIGGLSPELLELAGNQFLAPQQQAVVQALLQQEFARMNPEKMSPYQAKQLDLAERRLQAQLSGKLKTGNNITIGDKSESEFAKQTAKSQATMFADMTEAGVSARGELAQINELEGLVKQGVGGTGDAWQAWAQNSLGVNIGAGGQVEAFTAIINKLVPQQRAPGSGTMSDADLNLFKQSLPQLINSKEGNQIILNTMRGMAQYKRSQGEIAQQAMIGRITREEALQKLYELPDPLEQFRKFNIKAADDKPSADGEKPDDDVSDLLEIY